MQAGAKFLHERRPSSHLFITGHAPSPPRAPSRGRLRWCHRGDPGGPGLRLISGSVAGSTPAVASIHSPPCRGSRTPCAGGLHQVLVTVPTPPVPQDHDQCAVARGEAADLVYSRVPS